MNVTVNGITYQLTTETDIICLCAALELLDALARREAA
jgi:hypothetical protein